MIKLVNVEEETGQTVDVLQQEEEIIEEVPVPLGICVSEGIGETSKVGG
jgi:hypothetical protein